MEIDLRDNFVASGTDYQSFVDAVDSMVAATNVVEYNGKDISFLTYKKQGTVGEKDCYIFEDQSIPATENSERKLRLISVEKMKERGVQDEVLRELTNSVKLAFALKSNGKMSVCFVSKDAFNMLGARLGFGNESIEINPAQFKTSEEEFEARRKRDIHIDDVKNRLKKESLALVIRKNGYSKIFAVHSKNYPYIPQTIFKKIIDTINENNVGGLGEMRVSRWDMTHSTTSIHIEFPDVADQFQEFYELPNKIVPGIILATSDVGDCSLTAKAVWRIKGSAVVVQSVYKKVHKGKISSSKIVNDIDKSIFSKYRKLPERLAELLEIDIDDPIDAINRAFEESGLKKTICNRVYTKIIDCLASELSPGMKYTAYDVATTLMDLPSRVSGLSNHARDQLMNGLFDVAFINWEAVAKAEEIVITA